MSMKRQARKWLVGAVFAALSTSATASTVFEFDDSHGIGVLDHLEVYTSGSDSVTVSAFQLNTTDPVPAWFAANVSVDIQPDLNTRLGVNMDSLGIDNIGPFVEGLLFDFGTSVKLDGIRFWLLSGDVAQVFAGNAINGGTIAANSLGGHGLSLIDYVDGSMDPYRFQSALNPARYLFVTSIDNGQSNDNDMFGVDAIMVTAVPLPGSLALIGLGLASLVMSDRRRRACGPACVPRSR